MCCVRGVLDVLHQCLEFICISDSPANDSRASLNQSTPAAQYKVTESRLGQSNSKGIRSATSLAHWHIKWWSTHCRRCLLCVRVCLPAGLVTFSFATSLPAIETNISRAPFAVFIRCRFSSTRAEWRVAHSCFVASLPPLPPACPSCRRERSWWWARLASSRQSTPTGWSTRSGWRSATNAGRSWRWSRGRAPRPPRSA